MRKYQDEMIERSVELTAEQLNQVSGGKSGDPEDGGNIVARLFKSGDPEDGGNFTMRLR
jgi:hypothetical protein